MRLKLDKQNTGRISDGLFSMIIGNTIIPADLGDKEPVSFHGRVSSLWKTALLRPGTDLADPASSGSQAKGIRIFFSNAVGQFQKVLQV